MPCWLLLVVLGAPAPGVLEVRSPDYGATVSIDRRPVGKVPLPPWPLPAGLHRVEVRAVGRPAWRRTVLVAPGARVVLTVELPPAPPAPPPMAVAVDAPPAPTLRGAVGLRWAHDGARGDLDLAQRWRLTVAPAPRWAAAVAVGARSDVAGDAPALQGAPWRATDGRVRVLEATLERRFAAGAVLGGRQLGRGPGGRAYRFDGLRGRSTLGPTVEAHLGRRAEPLGATPDAPRLGGARAAIDRDAWRLEGAYLFHGAHHLDAEARWRPRPLQISLGAWLADAALVEGRGALAGRWGALSARAEGRLHRAPPTPFDLLAAIGLLPDEDAARWREGRLGVGFAPDAWTATADAGLRARADGWRRWDAAARVARRLGASEVGARGRGLWGEGRPPDGPALRSAVHGAAEGAWADGRWRLALSGGVARIDPVGAAARTLPEGSLRLEVGLVDDLALRFDAGVAAAHPSWIEGGGPLLQGGLAVVLR